MQIQAYLAVPHGFSLFTYNVSLEKLHMCMGDVKSRQCTYLLLCTFNV